MRGVSHRKISVFFSFLCVLLVASLQIVLSAEVSGVVTEQVWLTTNDGVRLNARIYRSKSDSAPMPGIVICHGLAASYQTMQSRFSLEFAKRGFTVAAIDLPGHGDSGGSMNPSIIRTIGDAQDFNGIGDYIEVTNDTSLDLQNAFTLSTWINAGEGIDQIILDKADAIDTHQDRNFKLTLLANGVPSLRYSSRANKLDGNVNGYTDLRNAGWKHVIGVYNGTHCYLYLDGEFKASDPTSDAPEGIGDNLWIGRGTYVDNIREFNGTIDEVRISDKARSDAWIKATYESGRDNLLDFGSEEIEADGGWLVGWDKRVKVTIDQNDVDSNLSDFPIMIHLSSSSGWNNDDVTFVFDEVGSDSKKIAVTEGDGVKECYVEIEDWDDTNEQAWLWTKIPTVSNTSNTVLYLYYDTNHADNTDYVGDTDSTPAEKVWDNNFQLVLHMQDDPNSAHVRDSTSNNNDGTKKSAGSDEVAGRIGKAQHFKSSKFEFKVEENNVRAGVNYLLNRTDVDSDKIAILGHSLGGATVFIEGYSDHRVKSVVAIAPPSFLIPGLLRPGLPHIRDFPRNLLLVVGERDNIVTTTSVLNLLRLSTEGGEEIGKLYGTFSEGNARKMIVSTGTDHAGEMFDPYIAKEAIAWVEASLGIESTNPISISPWLNISLPLSVFASLLSVFPVIVFVKEFSRLIRKGNMPQKSRATRMGVRRLVIIYLGAWGCGALYTLFNRSSSLFEIPLNLGLFNWVPVAFADILLNAYLIGSIILLLAIIIFRRTDEKPQLHMLEFRTSVILGALGFLILSILNFGFIWTFIDLLPTTEEVILMIKLFVVFIPLTLVDELWLRNLQNRLPDNTWQRIGVPIILNLLPKIFPLAFGTFIFGSLVLVGFVFLFIQAVFTAWLFDETGSVTGGVLFNALLYAWIVAIILPFGTFSILPFGIAL
jgi:pimeloyl-ACP methyl ester carboxylesterase